MAIEKAPEGYGITGDIGGPTEWYSRVRRWAKVGALSLSL